MSTELAVGLISLFAALCGAVIHHVVCTCTFTK